MIELGIEPFGKLRRRGATAVDSRIGRGRERNAGGNAFTNAVAGFHRPIAVGVLRGRHGAVRAVRGFRRCNYASCRAGGVLQPGVLLNRHTVKVAA